MPFPVPNIYRSEAADIARDEEKRASSPPSFFFAQGQALLNAAGYFTNERLKSGSYGGAANKHRQRIRSASFGQLMAAFEFCVKDFVAQVIDATDLFDDQVAAAKWIELDKSRILAQREVSASVGAVLIHPTLGWHDPESMNARFIALFERCPIEKSEQATLQRLWLVRHSVAHNAGLVTSHDAYRLRAPELAGQAIEIDQAYLEQTFKFLGGIVERLGDPVGAHILNRWMRDRSIGQFAEDRATFQKLHALTSVVVSRRTALQAADEAEFTRLLAASR